MCAIVKELILFGSTTAKEWSPKMGFDLESVARRARMTKLLSNEIDLIAQRAPIGCR